MSTQRAKGGVVRSAIVVGAGFSGIGAAIKLHEAGIDDFLILERANEVGGTWRDNTYPGIACDVPSFVYSYSFAPNPRWSKPFADGTEICDYLKQIAADFDIYARIHFEKTVNSAQFDDTTKIWTITTTDGDEYSARAIIVASGPLANTALPDIDGIETYRHKIIHTGAWDHEYDLAGKRVAVIGTGSTAVQVVPELVETCATVSVFQRTAGWVLPRPNAAVPQTIQDFFERYPQAQRLFRNSLYWSFELAALGMVWDTLATSMIARLSRRYLRNQVADSWLRWQLEPQFRPGCKRMLMSSNYYAALQATNCELITWPIARISEEGIQTCEGVEHQFDAIICATGYETAKTGTPYPIIGLGGRVLGDEWSRGAYAYKSVNVAGYPNLFWTFGPNAGPGHTSALPYMEAQIDYAVKAIRMMIDHNLTSLDVRPDAQDRYNRRLQERLSRTTWNSGCSSWYLTADGFNPSMYPGFATQYRRQLSKIDLDDYIASGTLPAGTVEVLAGPATISKDR